MGESFPARVAASLLSAIALPELITASALEYEQAAVEFGTNPGKLAALKDKLARNRLTTPLFDTAAFARNLEAVYEAMLARYQTDLAPEHIRVG
jgi:predicted O-linked N-acetylglucosamine transferase (SPINDLY family)